MSSRLRIAARWLTVTLTAAAAWSVGTVDATAKTIEGRFDVGGHKLYLRCLGTGSPTVVYLQARSTTARAARSARPGCPTRFGASTASASTTARTSILKRVASPHWMEQAVPDRIAKEIDLLFKRIARG